MEVFDQAGLSVHVCERACAPVQCVSESCQSEPVEHTCAPFLSHVSLASLHRMSFTGGGEQWHFNFNKFGPRKRKIRRRKILGSGLN